MIIISIEIYYTIYYAMITMIVIEVYINLTGHAEIITFYLLSVPNKLLRYYNELYYIPEIYAIHLTTYT